MNEDPTSLERLHDIALPNEVSWWPLATGWYVVFALLLLVATRFLWLALVQWKANAYRREALAQLAKASDAITVAEILRRTALVLAPRKVVADLSGEAWVKWLSDRCGKPVPPDVREQLVLGVYQRGAGESGNANSLSSLKVYASYWIREHIATSISPPEVRTTT